MSDMKKIIQEMNLRTDKNSVHSYVDDFYEKEFSKYKKLKNPKILEIGTCYGDSLVLWAEFFENPTILGVDTIPNLNDLFKKYECVKFMLGNAYTENTIKVIENNFEKFDIIIDDGPHTFQSHIYFMDNYEKLLAPGGVIIVEDINQNFDLSEYTKRGFEIINLMHVKNGGIPEGDNILAVKRNV